MTMPCNRNNARAGAGVAAALALFFLLANPAGAARPQDELLRYRTAERIASRHLATFDTLDFDVFTNRKWDRLKESHAADIVVHWPDGHQTKGIARHIADLKALFVYAPDTRIREHPIKIAHGEWTSVVGVMQGTFTRPMPVAGARPIAPTGKPFSLIMCTVGHWKNGVMDEEYLFWDNASYLRQIGIGK
ncbi:MAG TPA: ester cyclase [Rhizomicrobium sp.]